MIVDYLFVRTPYMAGLCRMRMKDGLIALVG